MYQNDSSSLKTILSISSNVSIVRNGWFFPHMSEHLLTLNFSLFFTVRETEMIEKNKDILQQYLLP